LRAYKLTPDNFVPVQRTPWAGAGLLESVKSRFIKPHDSGFKIGESWEFSTDPTYPSVITTRGEHAGKKLSDLGSFDILVKLISTGKPLSWQVHPGDSDPSLKPTQCGKPESWLVLEAEAGAGVYLGLKRPWTRSALRSALMDGSFRSEHLHFVPVAKGDFFDIAPGVPHALGPGLVIYEPQRISAAPAGGYRSGVTWRLWDWNRRYAGDGVTEDPQGDPREMHLDSGLSVINPEHQTGALLTSQALCAGVRSSPGAGVSVITWRPNLFYAVSQIKLNAGRSVQLNLSRSYASVVIVSGAVSTDSLPISAPDPTAAPSPDLVWMQGDSLLIVGDQVPLKLSCLQKSTDILLTYPTGCEISLT